MWILLELARGKLFHYPLPIYVALAIFCADTLVQSWYRLTDVLAAGWFAAMRLGHLGDLAGAGDRRRESWPRWHPDGDVLRLAAVFALFLSTTGILNAVTWGRLYWPYVLVSGWGATLWIASGMLLPNLPDLQVSRLAGLTMARRVHDNPALTPGREGGYEKKRRWSFTLATTSSVSRALGTCWNMSHLVPMPIRAKPHF